MSKPKKASSSEIIRQVYYADDRDVQRAGKIERLIASITHGLKAGKPIEVVVGKYHKPRTPEANAYLWAVPYAMMSEASGEERQEIHMVMCRQYFGEKVVEIMGEKYSRPVRTTTTNEKGEAEWLGPGPFAEFVDYVIRQAAFWYGLDVPPPTPKEVPRE